jgi:monoterpene epsilon-lactone hydrolase
MSPEAQAIVDLYSGIKRFLGKADQSAIEEQRVALDSQHQLTAEPIDVLYEEVKCPGTVRPAIWCKPLSANPSHVIIYIHGGGCFAGSPYSHRKLAGHLAKAAGSHALVTDFRLSPEHRYPAQLDDVTATFKWLLKQGILPGNIALVGDSAGGNLATTVTLRLKQMGDPIPGMIAPISPWVDMEGLGESLDSNNSHDVFANRGTEAHFSELYRGPTSAKDPLTNPLYADLSGLPPMFISVGGWEVLLSDAERLAKRAKDAGVDVTYEMVPEMQHVFQLMGGRAPEADASISSIGQWLRGHFGKEI